MKVLQRRQGQGRVRDLFKANEVVDEIKQHEEDFTLTYRVLDLTSCGLIGVSDASLGGVDRFGYPTDQDSKTVKVYSQVVGIFIGEQSLVSLGARGKFNALECDSRTITRVCRSSMAAETRGLGLQGDSMQFYGDLLSEILGESAPFSCSRTIVTDARNVYDKFSTEKGGLPQQKALTLEIATIREWLVNVRSFDTLDCRRKHDHEWSDEGSQRVKTTLGSGTTVRRMGHTKTLRWFARHRRLNPNVFAGRNLSKHERVRVRRSCTTSLIMWRVPGGSFSELSHLFIFLL